MADVVELGVQWREAGADVPERTKTRLKEIGKAAEEVAPQLGAAGKAAEGAAPSIGDRMGQAFERLERREPTMLLRRVKLMVDELGASALGASGPLGRLAFSLTSLIPGGAMTLGVVGGVALIGAEVKHILEFTDALDASLLKLNTEVAASTRAAPLFAALGREQRVETMRDPFAHGFWQGMGTTISNTLADMLSDPAGGAFGRPVVSGASIGREAQITTDEQGARLERLVFHSQVMQAERERTKTIQESALALDKARLGLHPTNVQIEALAERADKLKLSTSRLNDEQKKTIENNEKLTRLQEQQNAILKLQEDIWTKLGFAKRPTMTEDERAAALGVNPPGVGARERRGGIQGQGGAVVSDVGIMGFTGGVGGSGRIGPPADDVGIMGLRGGVTVGITPAGQAVLDKQRTMKIETDEKLAFTIGTIIAGHLVGLAAAISRGDAGGVVSGLGSAAGGVISALGALPNASKMLGPIGGIVSAVASTLGGLISLFSSHKPRIIISAFEDQALTEIRTLRADPLTTSFTIIGPTDIRTTQYQLGRLARRDAVTRLP